MKVETHNHPTAISPWPGAATGAGGEIRDEGATGRGGKPKAGLCGFTVSNLNLPQSPQPWERPPSRPAHIASPLDIMIEGPLGAAAYNNEFGRPNLCGYFRTYEQQQNSSERSQTVFGYHKPIMLAGGLGNIRADACRKARDPPRRSPHRPRRPRDAHRPRRRRSLQPISASNNTDLDFASVQRDNAEMERRGQEVIDRCWQLGEKNPILSIHDVGAGGLSNAFPELVKDGGVGGVFDLAAIPHAEAGLSPLEVWCNEAQERYVLALPPEHLPLFESICTRERCPFAVVGRATDELEIVLINSKTQMATRIPSTSRNRSSLASLRRWSEIVHPHNHSKRNRSTSVEIPSADAVERLLRLPDRRLQNLPHHHRRPQRRRPHRAGPDGRPVAGSRRGLRRNSP